MPHLQTPAQNLFLAALPEKDYERLKPSLELVTMPEGWAVYEDGGELDLVYFPTTCTISLLSRASGEIPRRLALVGNEGLFGISMLMGKKTTPARAVIATSGYAYRLRAASLRREYELASPLRYSLQRYTRGLLMRIAQDSIAGPAKPVRTSGLGFLPTANSATLPASRAGRLITHH
jgi:hypothetical protein